MEPGRYSSAPGMQDWTARHFRVEFRSDWRWKRNQANWRVSFCGFGSSSRRDSCHYCKWLVRKVPIFWDSSRVSVFMVNLSQLLLYRVSWTKWPNGHGCFAWHRSQEFFPATAGQGDEGSKLRSLNVGDVRWIGFVTHEKKSRLNRLLPMLLGPSLVGALLSLAILSLTVVFLNLTTIPALQVLRIDGELLYPAFKPRVKEYFAYLDVSQRVFGFTAAVDSYKTTKVLVQSVGKERLNSTSSVIVDALNLDETPYPQKVQIEVDDAATSTDYSVQVAKFGIFPESLTVSGQTDSGKHFSLCIPWGYIFFNTTIHLPTGLKELKLSLAYQLYVMTLPWTRRSNDSFSTYFDRQIPREKCRYGRHPLWEQAAFYAYSGSGCFAGMQRSWMSCGKARTPQTKRGLQILNGNISGSFCPSSIVRSANISNASGKCYPLQVSDAALELTSKSLLPEKDKDLQAKFNMFLQLPSGMVESLGLRNAFEPKSDLNFTLRKRSMTDTFKKAMVLAPGVEVHETFFGHLAFEVVDGSTLVNTSVLQIMVFSEDMDCHIESISTPQRSCEGNPMGEVCKDGWKPTSSFVLPMSLFHQVLVQEENSSLDLVARGTCRSLEDFMNDSFQDPNGAKVSLRIKQPREQVLWVPMIAGQELPATKEERDLEQQQTDRLNVRGSWHKDPSSMQLVVAWRQNCSLKWGSFTPEHDVASGLFKSIEEHVIRSDQELSTSDLCGAASLNVTKACGGTLQSSSIEVPLESTLCCAYVVLRGPPQHLTVFFVCAKTPNISQSLLPQSLRENNLEKLKFEATLSCSDRLKSQRVSLELVVGNHSREPRIEVSDFSPFEFTYSEHWVLHRIPLNGIVPGTGSLKKKESGHCAMSDIALHMVSTRSLMPGLHWLAFFACLRQVNLQKIAKCEACQIWTSQSYWFAFPTPMWLQLGGI